MDERRTHLRVQDLYPTLLELALIAALILVTLVFLLSKRFDGPQPGAAKTFSDDFHFTPIPPTRHPREAPPTRPTIPVEDPTLDPEADILMADLDDPIYLIQDPPPPPRPIDEVSVAFLPVEDQPRMIGGAVSLYAYLRDNDLYPEMARQAGVEGLVQVGFVVGVDGMPRDIEVLDVRPRGIGFEEAALTAIAAMRFEPGVQRDKPVPVRMTQVIRFQVR